MFRRDLLDIVRARPHDTTGLAFAGGVEEDGFIVAGELRTPSGETRRVRHGYVDLMGSRVGADNVANLTNFLPGAGRGYEPLWRARSLSLLTGEDFPNERELGIVASLVGLDRGGLFLDLGCSAGLYARGLSRRLGNGGAVIGIDISPSMLKEAVRRSRGSGASFARADWENLPFADASFAGAVCGGSLNEVGEPARALRETARVLQPGGRLAVMGILRAATPNGRRLQRFLSTGGIRFFEQDELRSMLDHSGFAPDPLLVHGPVFFAGATRR